MARLNVEVSIGCETNEELVVNDPLNGKMLVVLFTAEGSFFEMKLNAL